ncbi:MAG: phosphate ABC transporter substrate-binding protein [Candidatus Promineifilaceae bacterium]
MILRVGVLIFALVWLVACTAEPLPPPTIIVPETAVLQIGVSSGAEAIVPLVAGAPTANTVLNTVTGSGSTLLASLTAGELDAVLVHVVPPDSSVWFNPVALDGLVVVVHPDNPVTALTLGEVQAVFNGRLTNWQSLGGPDAPIQLVGRERGSGARQIFAERVMAGQRMSINALVVADDAALLTAVANDPNAIGYSFMGTAANTAVRMLTIDNVPPANNTVAAQAYPLTTPLYFVSQQEPSGALRAWLAWVQSETGQMAVAQRYGRVR